MKLNLIQGYDDFCDTISTVGFCLSSGKGEDIFNIGEYFSDDIEYHTGDNNLDPWRWRIRCVKETAYISYGKVFFNKSGWISVDWLPYFISLRRGGKSFEELNYDGLISLMEKQVYEYIKKEKQVAAHRLTLEFGASNKTKISKALTNLQMKLLITVSDETQKISSKGLPYGWPVMVYSTLEEKFGEELTEKAEQIPQAIAFQKVSEHIKKLNPEVQERKVKAFIKPLT